MVFLIQQHISYESILISSCIIFVLLGIGGRGIHYLASCVLGKTAYLARTVGISYALGLLIQFLNNNMVSNDTVESVVLSVLLMIWVILILRLVTDRTVGKMYHNEMEQNQRMPVLEHLLLMGVILIIIVLLMTCIFATLDNVVTLFRAEGSVDIGQWPRLLLAVSGLLAGVLFDIREHRYMHIIMYCITLLSVICVLVIETGGPFLFVLISIAMFSYSIFYKEHDDETKEKEVQSDEGEQEDLHFEKFCEACVKRDVCQLDFAIL